MKCKISALKHINPNKTSIIARYKSYNYGDSIDRSYVFSKSSCNDTISPILCEDLSLGICVINDPISFKTLMKCFNENAYYFLNRKYPKTKKEN